MAIGKMFELTEPYVPNNIDRSLIEIGSIKELDNLGGGQEFYYISSGEGDRPQLKGPFFYYGTETRKSPRYPEEGIQHYFICIKYVDVPSEHRQVKLWKWYDTRYLFNKPYHAIFTSKSKAVQFMNHVNSCYDNDPKWKKWIANHEIESAKKRSYHHDMRRIRDADESETKLNTKKNIIREY